MKTLFRIISFLISAVVVTWIMFGSLVKGALSVTKLDEGIYCLEFSGNDGFDGFLKQGGAAGPMELSAYITKFMSRGFSRPPKAEPQPQDFGCSTMAVATPDGERFMGRNFDWESCRCIISKVNPRGGYSYISAFNPDFFGFGPDIKAGVEIERRPTVDEAPTYAKILGVEMPWADGVAVDEFLK